MLVARGVHAPDFDEFWDRGELTLPTLPWDGGIVRAFRRDPEAAPLPTPSGKVEITSGAIASFGYPDCPGHPTWLPPSEGSTASSILAPPAKPQRLTAVSRSASIRRMPRRAVSAMATSCGFTTTVGPALPVRC